MGPLRRPVSIVLFAALALALTSLPTLRNARVTGSAFTPAVAWAGGSPDETLKPPTPPPPQASAKAIGYHEQLRYEPTGTAETLSRSEWWRLVWRVTLASVLRI
ncbi:MAG: hypothetical protein ACM3JJ_05720 [Hyphomicrobiales bacterium]